MKQLKYAPGFSAVEALIVLVVVSVLGLGGWLLLRHDDNTSTAAGSTAAIDELTAQDADSEAALDSRYATDDLQSAQNADAEASNLGDAYNESSL
jgi:competence protein ComGC